MRVALILLLVFNCLPALGHEFWLEPDRFEPQRDMAVRLSIRIGENFSGNPWTPNSNGLARLTMISPQAKLDLTLALMKAAAGALAVTPAATGTTIVALATDSKFIEIDPAKFAHYLAEDGLDDALAWRAAHGETEKPGRELYRREAATLLRVEAPTTLALRDTGFDLQILPARNPYAAQAVDNLRVQILWRGAPFANALVQRWTRLSAGGLDVAKARTDPAGFVSFALPSGDTMLSVVHMSENDDRTVADWRSAWGSLTFHVK